MISNRTEKSCLHVDASGADDSINGWLHLPTLRHPASRWCAHGAIGVQRPWISCCGNADDNRESAGDGGHGGGTISGGNGAGGGGRLLQKIAPPLGAQLGERQLEQPQYLGGLLQGRGGRRSWERRRLQRRPPHLLIMILIILIPLMSLLLMHHWLNTLKGRSCCP